MQATEKTYNGWTNYETWAVALHLDNDQGSYNMVREKAAAITRHIEVDTNLPLSVRVYAKRFRLADRLKDMAETLCGIGDESDDYGIAEPSPLGIDMIRAALSEVDWNEIADNVLSES